MLAALEATYISLKIIHQLTVQQQIPHPRPETVRDPLFGEIPCAVQVRFLQDVFAGYDA